MKPPVTPRATKIGRFSSDNRLSISDSQLGPKPDKSNRKKSCSIIALQMWKKAAHQWQDFLRSHCIQLGSRSCLNYVNYSARKVQMTQKLK